MTYMAAMRTVGKGLLGSAKARLGDVPGGEASWDAALADAHGMDDRYGEAQTRWARGRTRMRQVEPDYAAGLGDLDAALALFDTMEARPASARVHRDRAQALRALGRTEDAAAEERRSRELAADLGLKDFSAG